MGMSTQSLSARAHGHRARRVVEYGHFTEQVAGTEHAEAARFGALRRGHFDGSAFEQEGRRRRITLMEQNTAGRHVDAKRAD